MIKFNIEEIKKNEDLQKYKQYIPLKLIPYVTDYMENATTNAKKEIYLMRNNIPSTISAREEYFDKDIINWLNNNPQFKNIIKE